MLWLLYCYGHLCCCCFVVVIVVVIIFSYSCEVSLKLNVCYKLLIDSFHWFIATGLMSVFWVSEHLAKATNCGLSSDVQKGRRVLFHWTNISLPVCSIPHRLCCFNKTTKKRWEQNGISIQVEVEEPTNYSWKQCLWKQKSSFHWIIGVRVITESVFSIRLPWTTRREIDACDVSK